MNERKDWENGEKVKNAFFFGSIQKKSIKGLNSDDDDDDDQRKGKEFSFNPG